MFDTYSPNDVVHIEGIGYCTLISCGKSKTLNLPKKHFEEDLLKPLYLAKQKESLYFDPESFLFDESTLIALPSQSIPIPLPDTQSDPQLGIQRSSKSRTQSLVIEDSAAAQPNIIKAKLLRTQYHVYAPDSKLSHYIQLRVKTLFSNRQQYVFHINISSNILQLKNKIIELTKQPHGNFDNIRLLSTDGFIQQFGNNKELIYQTKIRDNSKLLFMANIRFSIDPNEKGQNLALSNNNRTVTKAAKEGKFQLCLATLQISNGKIYFETKIQKITQDDDLFIGVAKKGTSLSIPANTVEKIPFWGYNCMSGRKYTGNSTLDIASPIPSISDFGSICKVNDSIGTFIQVQKKMASITYYLNGKCIGKAFESIECPLTPAIIFGTGDIQVTINCLSDVPFDSADYMNQY